MGVIASFSKLEAHQLDLYLTILNTPDDQSVASAYLSLGYGSAKAEFVNAIASARLNDVEIVFYEIISKAIKSAQKKRDKLAHGYWGCNKSIKEALILAEPKATIGAAHQLDQNAIENMFVYRASDFDSMTNENYELTRAVLILAAAIRRHDDRDDSDSARDSLYAQLKELPVVRERMDHQVFQDLSSASKKNK